MLAFCSVCDYGRTISLDSRVGPSETPERRGGPINRMTGCAR